jgi:Fe-Mn family superoxide dismutase
MKTFLFKNSQRFFSTKVHQIELPKLDYDYADLEPVMSKENLELHHKKHHQTYIDNYNKLMKDLSTALENNDSHKVAAIAQDIKFNAGSHINHSIFWKNLAPVKSKKFLTIRWWWKGHRWCSC